MSKSGFFAFYTEGSPKLDLGSAITVFIRRKFPSQSVKAVLCANSYLIFIGRKFLILNF
jgi:hypothetical protein